MLSNTSTYQETHDAHLNLRFLAVSLASGRLWGIDLQHAFILDACTSLTHKLLEVHILGVHLDELSVATATFWWKIMFLEQAQTVAKFVVRSCQRVVPDVLSN